MKTLFCINLIAHIANALYYCTTHLLRFYFSGWTVRLKTNFNRDTPIWLLGHCYHKKLVDDQVSGKDVSGLANGMEGFKQDFISRIWFTYRREFPTLSGSSYTTDCGWGCMLRSGQMLLAQGLLCHLLGRCRLYIYNLKFGCKTRSCDSFFYSNNFRFFPPQYQHGVGRRKHLNSSLSIVRL